MTYPKGLSLIFYHKVYRLQLKLDLYLEARAAFLMCYYNSFLLERVENCKKMPLCKNNKFTVFSNFFRKYFSEKFEKNIFFRFSKFFSEKDGLLEIRSFKVG